MTGLVLLFLWSHISISVTYWYVQCKTGTIKAEYRKKRLYKLRLLLLILFKPRISLDYQGCVLSCDKYSIDFNRLVPKIIRMTGND